MAGPRYDLRLLRPSPVFGVQDPAAAFAEAGGVVMWRPALDNPDKATPPPAAWGPPAATLPNADGGEVQVFCSPALREAVTRP